MHKKGPALFSAGPSEFTLSALRNALCAYAAIRPPLGNQMGRLPLSKPTHSKRAGGKPYTPISSRSPFVTTIWRPNSSTASEKESLSISPSRRDSMLLTEKQNLDMSIPPRVSSPSMVITDALTGWYIQPATYAFLHLLSSNVAGASSIPSLDRWLPTHSRTR